MKLFGTNKKSRHTSRAGGSHVKSPGPKQKLVRGLIIAVCVVLAVTFALVAAYKIWVRPPDVSGSKNDWTGGQAGGNGGGATGSVGGAVQPSVGNSVSDSRTGQKYTFLLVGMDDGNGNTDTIMTATFDTSDYTLNIVSIPRDTLVNVSWSVKKINSYYNRGGIDATMEGVGKLLGYMPDFYVCVDMEAFVTLVDEIGGVWFDVPQNMYYVDEFQGLYIDFDKGYQLLNGEDALKVMRFRRYGNADIGRINTQQQFLLTVCGQLMENMDSLSISTLAEVFLNHVETSLDYGEVIWLAQEFFKMDFENIDFHTMPADYYDDIYHGGAWNSYVTVYVDEWIDMVNEYLNPFDDPVELRNLDILTRNSSGYIYPTTGVYAGRESWGNNPPTPEPPDDPEPAPAPETGVTPEQPPTVGETPEDPIGGETSDPPAGGETEEPTPEPEETPEQGGETEDTDTPTDGEEEGGLYYNAHS